MGVSSGEEFVSTPYGKSPGRESAWLKAPVILEKVCDCKHKLSRTEKGPGLRWRQLAEAPCWTTRGKRPLLIVELFLSGCDSVVPAEFHRDRCTSVLLKCLCTILLRMFHGSVPVVTLFLVARSCAHTLPFSGGLSHWGCALDLYFCINNRVL